MGSHGAVQQTALEASVSLVEIPIFEAAAMRVTTMRRWQSSVSPRRSPLLTPAELEVLQPMEISDVPPCAARRPARWRRADRPQRCARSVGHGFCDGAAGSAGVALERGPACIHDKCPQPECEEVITGDVWSATLPPEGLAKLQQAALRSFVEWNSLLAYCPTASCGLAAAHTQQRAPPELLGCGCGASFCVLCGEPPHWPLSCSRRKRWTSLLNQSPDAKMIISLTRPCPSCGVRTQRAHGYAHLVHAVQCRVVLGMRHEGQAR